jgi:hypothetical protein
MRSATVITTSLFCARLCATDRVKFAKVVFFAAGVWGVVVLTPLYFLFDVTGKPYPPPDSYPHFFYGFLSVAMAWQFAFFVIGSNPARFRLMMIPAIVEKLGYIIGTAVLYGRSRIGASELMTVPPDLVLCVLFAIAWAKTREQEREGW